MKELFKQLIVDFQKRDIPLPTLRDIPSFNLPDNLHKAFTLIGMRRSGKTWTLFQKMHQLIDEGVKRERIIYINFEDDRLLGMSLSDMQSILDAFHELYPSLIKESGIYLFFDEIHSVTGWENFIRRLLDNEQYKIYITGSSAKMLSKEIASSLRGRTLVREIFPYNFREYLRHIGKEVGATLSTKEKAALNYDLNNYLLIGGFPEIVEADESMHREILQGYIETVIYRDIVERYEVTNVQVLRKLLVHCLQNPASSFSVNKMYNMLKTQGYSISKNSLYDFMKYFEDAYCLFSVPAFNLSGKKSAMIPCKIYPVDVGLIKAYSVERNFQHWSALESAVFSVLRRKDRQINYFITAIGQEVDFLTTSDDGVRRLYQVCISIKSDDTRKREFNAIQLAMKEIGLKESTIITLDEEAVFDVVEGRISVIPLWKFLL
jgi:hypothetical protein